MITLYKSFMKRIYRKFSAKDLVKIAQITTYGLLTTISGTLLCFSSPQFGITRVSAQTTTTVDIREIVSTLIQILRSKNIEARVNAARALGGMGTEARLAEPSLMVALNDTEKKVSYTAATALANIGGDTKSALPILLEALNDESKWIRNDAASALSNLALNTQAKSRSLSNKELDQAIKDLEKTMEVMQKSEFEISPQAIKSVNDSLDSLKREKQRV